MASRVQQDTFIDDSDDACPLCVEEFDLSDKNFRPCVCGYQVCQFCYNNIKNNMNGLCPACRRRYDDKNIEWKVVSPEEFKADIALQARKKAAARQKEAERKQVETLNRKHLAGLRVVQKNLVYVVGLNPRIREEDLLQTLRGDQYFGQYGKIVKIVVSKAKEGANPNQSMGVYVTFARKQDAASCIAAVDGSQNGDRVLRAQYGTTKYCSAYLRNETCNNKSCMFLHETGEDNDSFSRQDLSSMNVVSTQRPAASAASRTASQQGPSGTQVPQPQPPPQQAPQTVTAATQPMGRQGSKDNTMSRSDSGDGSALPSSASWANKSSQIQQSRSTSQAASRSTPSPKANSVTLTHLTEETKHDDRPVVNSNSQSRSHPTSGSASPSSRPTATVRHAGVADSHPPMPLLSGLLNSVNSPDFKFVFSSAGFTPDDLKAIAHIPPLIDDNGGAKRRLMHDEEEREHQKREQEEKVLQVVSATEEDDNRESGSLQLGGEPEATSRSGDVSNRGPQQRHAIQPPSQNTLATDLPFDNPVSATNNLVNLPISNQGLTPLQQQQLLLLKPNGGHAGAVMDHLQPGFPGNLGSSQSYRNPPSLFQARNPQANQPLPVVHTHGRQASRYTFANDSNSASADVKLTANAKVMAQQSAMMPPSSATQGTLQATQQHPLGAQFYGSAAQGAPPGLKTAGTPPISGGGMFGQGHGFATAMGGGQNYGGIISGRDSNAEMMRELLRGRTGSGIGHGAEVGKREYMFPSNFHQHPSTTPAPAPGLLSSLYGAQLGTYPDLGVHKQKKKGKKHRHANTSSFGGGGIVDLADPSILQARLHHGASGNGQGLFGGQGQGKEILPPLDEISDSVDALVADSPTELTSQATATVGLKPTTTPIVPAAPPGLPVPYAHPLPTVADDKHFDVQVQAQSPNVAVNPSTSTVVPAVPVLPGMSAQSTSPAKKEHNPVQSTSPQPIKSTSPKSSIDFRKLHSDPSRSATQAVGPSTTSPKREAMGGVSSAKVTVQKTRKAHETSATVSTPAVKPAITHARAKGQEGTKRQLPGKLNISAVTETLKEIQAGPASSSSTATESSVKTSHTVPASITAGLRTLRVLPTPKTETPSTAPTSALPPAAASPVGASKLPSRQPSLVSINRPATPVGDLISDNASMTSTSMSRANSPPPSKVGVAPVRQTTKSQQKKERQARAKMIEESKKIEEVAEKVVPEEPIQAPIIGRKKKTKKSTAIDATASSTPAPSRPESPAEKENVNVAAEVEKPLPAVSVKEPKRETKKELSKTQEKKPADTSTVAQSSTGNDPAPKGSLTASSIIADLQAHGELTSAAMLQFFNNIPGINYRHDITSADFLDLDRKILLSEDERLRLSHGQPIHLAPSSDKTSARMMISPAGAFLRGLSPEQEQRFVELEKQTIAASGPAKFNPATRHGTAETGASRPFQTHHDGALSSAVGQPHQQQQRSALADAHFVVGRKLDEALSYVNQFLDSNPTSNPLSTTTTKPTYDLDDPTHARYPSAAGAARSAPQQQMWAAADRPLMSVEEAETAMLGARKETEALEKRLNGLLRKNRRFVFGTGGH